MKRRKREERLEMIRSNVQLKYAIKRKVSNATATEIGALQSLNYNNCTNCVCRAAKRTRQLSCFSTVKKNRQSHQETRKTRII